MRYLQVLLESTLKNKSSKVNGFEPKKSQNPTGDFMGQAIKQPMGKDLSQKSKRSSFPKKPTTLI